MNTAPIFGFNASKRSLVDEVVRRVVERTSDPLHLLNEAAFLEIRRLEGEGGRELEGWRVLARSLGRMGEGELVRSLRQKAEELAWDVAGNFDPKVYRFAAKAMPPILGALLSPRATLKNWANAFDLATLDDHILVQGPREHLRLLAERGTLIFVPTHLSNMDSVVFGFALERAGLPPATYGAGKNLFSNPVLSYFMHNLGAYRVDRRIRHTLYKDVLKAYSCVLIERGYHSLFFPGGTRSRSGGIERRLKLGLAGTGVEAFARNAEAGQQRGVFFVPATINYLLTLEAETLIDDFLQEEGKHRYIIEDDESARLGRVTAFLQKLTGLDAGCIVRLGRPLDAFGNFVDDEGKSHDNHGRVLDARSYVVGRSGRYEVDAARDAEYTRELGEVITRAYRDDTVVLPTHLVAACAFARLAKSKDTKDLFMLLRADPPSVPTREFLEELGVLLEKARGLDAQGKLVLGPTLRNARPDAILEAALRAFAAGYHTRSVLVPRGADLSIEDPRLLLYYQNRLASHGLAIDFSAGGQRQPS